MKHPLNARSFSRLLPLVLGGCLAAAQVPSAQAQIAHDPAAPGATRPTVLAAPNGVPLVNIQTPSAAGVSRNRYRQFDIDGRGAILNNSRTNTATQLGGWVQGNPWLATGSARVILNEVNSSDPSVLRGYLEVAGAQAEVVVANPAGILCDGCGFINAGRATLAAASPVLGEGQLQGWRTAGGTLEIAGSGFDGRGLDHATLIAHAVRVDAQAQVTGHLQVVAGAGSATRDAQGEVSSAQPLAPGSQPAVAIDVSQLGGMYAGRITLVGHGQGVGVRNDGTVGAMAGELRLTASGRLENTGRLLAWGDLRLHADGDIANPGEISATGDIGLRGETGVHHSGLLQAGGALTVSSAQSIAQEGLAFAGGDLTLGVDAGQGGAVTSGAQSLTLAGLQPDGLVGATGRLAVSADVLSLQGEWEAGDALSVRGGQVTLAGGVLRAGALQAAADSGALDLRGADLYARRRITLRTPQALLADDARVEAPALEISAHHLSNRRGLVLQTGPGALALDLPGGLDNTGGDLFSLGALDLRVSQVDNTGGRIAAARDLTLQTAHTTHTTLSAGAAPLAGEWFAGQRLHLQVAGEFTLGTARLDAQAIAIDADALVNPEGSQLEAPSLSLRTRGPEGLRNAGVLRGDQVTISAELLDNTGVIEGAQLQIDARRLDNRGLIDGTQVDIQAAQLDNRGTGRIYGDWLAIGATELQNRAEGGHAPVIAARESLELGAQRLQNTEHALIFSAGDMAIGGALSGAPPSASAAPGPGRLASGRAATVSNLSATVEALGDLRIDAQEIFNTDLHFRVAQVELPPEPVHEYQVAGSGTRYAVGTPGLFVQNEESDHLYTPDGGRWDHWYDYAYLRQTSETRVVSADPARILSGGDLHLDADRIRNDQSQIVAGGRLVTRAGALENVAVSGIRDVQDVGTVTEVWRRRRDGHDTTGRRRTAYEPPPTRTHFPLTHAQALAHQAPASGNVAPAPLTSTSGNSGTSDARDARDASGDDLAGVWDRWALALPDLVGARPPAVRTASPVPADPAGPTGPAGPRLPTSSLFRVLPESAGSGYLVETDPRFTDGRRWLGSDYLLDALGVRPAETLRRLGDGFYEQRLVREQITELTGYRRLAGYADDQAQYRALMDEGATVARQLNLSPGVALSAEQVAQLTADIVWLEAQDVELPDGSHTRVLVPRVYLAVREGDLLPSGALIAGSQTDIAVSGDLVNGGTIAGRQVLALSADNLRNRGGQIHGGVADLRARTDIVNLGGQISGRQALILDAGRDIVVTSTTGTASNAQGTRTQLDRVAGLYVTGEGGVLLAHAGRDLALTAGVVRSEGSAALSAGRDVVSGTVETSASQRQVWNADNHRSESARAEVGSSVSARGALTVEAGQDIRARAGQFQSEEGATVLRAQRDVALDAGQSSSQVDSAHRHTHSGLLSDETVRTQTHQEDTRAQVSQVGGRQVLIEAGRDIRTEGAEVISDTATALHAGGSLNLGAAQESYAEQTSTDSKRSGLFSSGGASVTLGSQRRTTEQSVSQTSAVHTTVGSLHGNLDLQAGATYRDTGADLLAPEGSIAIQARQVESLGSRETLESQSVTRTRQTGVTVAVSNPVLSAVQTGEQMAQAASHTGSSRMHALAAGSTVLAAREAAQAVSANPEMAGGVTLSISAGTSRSESTQTTSSTREVGSRLLAGSDVTVSAAGGGPDSSLTLHGTEIQAGGRVTLAAEGQVRLDAARSQGSEHGTERSSSASVGLNAGFGGGAGAPGPSLGVTVSGSVGRGHSDGESLTHQNAHVSAGQALAIQSGGDTVLAGAVISAPTVTADIGGRLVIESLQDTQDFSSRRTQVGGSVTFGPATTGNLSLGGSRIDSQWTSVGEQSAIRAGDGGFQVSAHQGTDLIGGALTSTEAAHQAGLNRLDTPDVRTTDLENHASYSASAASVNLGAGFSPEGRAVPGGTSAGVGSDSGQAHSTTLAGVTGLAGHSAARTGDAETGLTPIFDAERVQQEVDAQVAITADFGQRGSRAWGEYANDRFVEAVQTGDTDAQQCWAPEGACRGAGHAVIGGATGGVAGMAGGATAAYLAPQVLDVMQQAGLPEEIARQVVGIGAAIVGTALGGPQAGAAALNEAGNNTPFAIPLIVRGVIAAGPPAARACMASPQCLSLVAGMGAAAVEVVGNLAYPVIPTGPPGFGDGDRPNPSRGTALPDPGTGRGTSTTSPASADPTADSGDPGRPMAERPPLDVILGHPATEPLGPDIMVAAPSGGRDGSRRGRNTPPPEDPETTRRLDALGPKLPEMIDRAGARHILTGDRRDSGGHAWPGMPGKTPFPPDWSDARIIATTADIAANPEIQWAREGNGGYESTEQLRDGVKIRVVVDRPNKRVVSAYPVNLPRNPR